ncbi:MAG: hypothetical protein AABX08_02590 [Nanoarchaeota archaeon]
MEDVLLNNIKIIFNSAELVYDSKDYTSATILYFKTLFVALDLIIFNKNKFTPKDHTERFRILQRDFPNYYSILDKYFPIYQTTYSTMIDKGTCKEIRENVIKIIKKNFRISI